MAFWRSKLSAGGVGIVTIAASAAVWGSAASAENYNIHKSINCATDPRCTEVQDSQEVFGYYVGHDEPSLLFYSKTAGSGNHQTYHLTLPTQPATAPDASGSTSTTWDFQLHPAFWFGMAMCDPNSYPNVTQTCVADSDSNIVPLAKHAGTAFMEMQFYPPGWFPTSCTAKAWCAALNIDSLAQNPIAGTQLNNTCASQTGIEYVNFAYITKNGVSNGPANPIQANASTFGMNPNTFLMSQGDQIDVRLFDTADGLKIVLDDRTNGTSGSMTASKKNGFGSVQFQPRGTACTLIPYDFHPMYSTSQPPATVACPAGVYPNTDGTNLTPACTDQGGTRVPWAAHSYNIAFSDEIGHFDWCNNIVEPGAGAFSMTPGVGFGSGHCGISGKEGPGWTSHNDGDSSFACFTGAEGADFTKNPPGTDRSAGVPVPGCVAENDGFDGASYQADRWPSTSSAGSAPSPITFSGALTGAGDTEAYSDVAFEADLPRITAVNVTDYGCSRRTGTNWSKDPVTGVWTNSGAPCPNPPLNDTGGSAFYPIFNTSGGAGPSCRWMEGQSTLAGAGGSNFGGTSTTEFGQKLWKLSYLTFGGGGAINYRFNDDHNDLAANPC